MLLLTFLLEDSLWSLLVASPCLVFVADSHLRYILDTVSTSLITAYLAEAIAANLSVTLGASPTSISFHMSGS